MWRQLQLEKYHQGKTLAENILKFCGENISSCNTVMIEKYTDYITISEDKLKGIFSNRTLCLIKESENLTSELTYLNAEMVEAIVSLNKIENSLGYVES